MQDGYRPSVLIIDDERGLRLGTKRLLEMEGYNVSVAENGTEGIKLGTSYEFDLAVIDLKMPDVDGLKVLTEIRKRFPDTVCFIATAYASYETAIESAKLGAFTYLPKPFTPEELINNLKHGYEKRELNLEAEKWRKEREERLLEVAFEKTRLNTIINSITDGVLVVNKNGQAVLYNPAALIFLELGKIEIEEYIIDKIHPSIKELINKFLIKGISDKKSFSSQIELIPGELFIEATSSAVPHPDGTLAGVVVVIKNITGLKKIEQLKSQFVSMVSHELKAPLSAVYGYLNILSGEIINIPEEQKQKYLKRSRLRLDGLLKMVNDLLDISRMETKTVQREIKDVSVESVINSVIELISLEIEKKKISVKIINTSDQKFIKADQEEITRLFMNLISNAVKYNKERGYINIEIVNEDNYIRVSVEDSGIGLKPGEKAKLFKEFFRAKNDFTKDISGTGLGLSIVKRIVDSYSGKIEIDSEFEKGTLIKVYLPK
jgi:signal transduction histidine kinase